MKIAIPSIIWLFAVTCLCAKDLGKVAVTFPVEEESPIISMISQAALHESELKDYTCQIERHIHAPAPIPGIGKATQKRSTVYDPTYTVPEDIEFDGHVAIKAGTMINLLETTDLPGGMLFFDGSDLAQVAWARKAPVHYKWILVKGSPLALEEVEGRAIYFDQFGFFTTRLQIHNVPAKVMQSGSRLLVEEIPVDENGEERW